MQIPQLFLFDLDGTLIDSRADLAAAVNAMRARHGLSALPLATVAAYVGDGVRTLAVRALARDAEAAGLAVRETNPPPRAERLVDAVVSAPVDLG